ncbi:MAG: peroxiredoxin [Rhodospirillales bacterium]|nr:peroxiredoxin [Rhodospirillales bacterium]
MSIDAGDQFPEFTLQTDGGGVISRADLHGSVAVVFFYPRDDTPQCTKEAQAFRDSHHEFEAAGIKVVGISADDIKSHDKFKLKHGLNFILASDKDTELAQQLGVWVEKSMYGKKYMGLERSTFLVDREGAVRRVWRKVKVPGHAADVLAAAREL